MTFTEAAIEVLRREGKPLHFKKIAEIAVRDSLLDHVGKIPDEVMGGQLASHCRLPHADRKVLAVQAGTFALVEWGLDEDPAGLEGLIEPPPEDEIAYRPRERHPTPSREIARSTGREGRGRRREEGEEREERRGRRFPPPAEVAYEILAGADRPLTLAEVGAQGAERFLMPDAFVREPAALAAALAEDNRRRESAGRKPLFALEGEQVSLAAQPEPGERAATPLAAVRPAASAGELRRAALLALRRRVRECDPATVEHVVAKLLEATGLRELKVAKRGRDHVVYTGRRRMGLADVRHCVRVIRAGTDAGRREVSEVRRDVGNYGAQIGVIVSAGEAPREARGEATAPGQVPVLLLCGDALAEALAEASVGCRPVIVPEVDEAFFRAAGEAAQAEEAARRARREDRERREPRAEGGERRERGERPSAREPQEADRTAAARPEEAAEPPSTAAGISAGAGPQPVASIQPAAVADPGAAVSDEDEGAEGDEEDEGDVAEGAPSQAGAAPAPGDGRRRRRRRRRRGGRGRGREAEGGAPRAGADAGTPAPPDAGAPAEARATEGAAPVGSTPAPPATPDRREPPVSAAEPPGQEAPTPDRTGGES